MAWIIAIVLILVILGVYFGFNRFAAKRIADKHGARPSARWPTSASRSPPRTSSPTTSGRWVTRPRPTTRSIRTTSRSTTRRATRPSSRPVATRPRRAGTSADRPFVGTDSIPERSRRPWVRERTRPGFLGGQLPARHVAGGHRPELLGHRLWRRLRAVDLGPPAPHRDARPLPAGHRRRAD